MDKPGYKTTEFWLTIGYMVFNIVSGAAPWVAPIVVGSYALARGLAKANVIKGFAGKALQQGPEATL